jgi:hypothetical protein
MNITNKIVIEGKVYKLQHPGNRAWLDLQSSMLDVKTQTLNMTKMMDYCFEHVVFPVEGKKLNLDSLHPRELGVWQIVLPSFLRGELDTGYVYPDDTKSRKLGARLLQEISEKSK